MPDDSSTTDPVGVPKAGTEPVTSDDATAAPSAPAPADTPAASEESSTTPEEKEQLFKSVLEGMNEETEEPVEKPDADESAEAPAAEVEEPAEADTKTDEPEAEPVAAETAPPAPKPAPAAVPASAASAYKILLGKDAPARPPEPPTPPAAEKPDDYTDEEWEEFQELAETYPKTHARIERQRQEAAAALVEEEDAQKQNLTVWMDQNFSRIGSDWHDLFGAGPVRELGTGTALDNRQALLDNLTSMGQRFVPREGETPEQGGQRLFTSALAATFTEQFSERSQGAKETQAVRAKQRQTQITGTPRQRTPTPSTGAEDPYDELDGLVSQFFAQKGITD